jgi:hypothetical protein
MKLQQTIKTFSVSITDNYKNNMYDELVGKSTNQRLFCYMITQEILEESSC